MANLYNANIHPRLNGGASPFPFRLHTLLHDRGNPSQEQVVRFLPHGRAFQVFDLERFRNEILPVWFNETSMEWFHHQLDIHGFQAITQGRDEGAYYHGLFLRGMASMHLVQHITTDPNNLPRRDPQAPDFHAMPVLERHPPAAASRRTANLTLSALGPIVGQNTLPPGAIGFPVLPRFAMPAAEEGEIQSNGVLLDNHEALFDDIFALLRATDAQDGNQDQDHQETTQEATEEETNANEEDTEQEESEEDNLQEEDDN